MPFPSASSYTQTKWLAFFAELTAKLTHHNVLVVMEGAELLKRLLISRVSIAAILQQGELLVRLLDSWRGCATAERLPTRSPVEGTSTNTAASAPTSALVALNDELSFVLAESISQCIDLMCSLYADGDTYYCLLVLARAGPMLEVLVDVLETAPPQLYGITASLLQQLLSLPLGHSDVEMVKTTNDGGEKFLGLDKATLAQLHKSVALRRHIRALVEAVQEHGALLQHTADVLAGLLARQQGPRCLAAVYLFNCASKRLRKFELRYGQTRTDAPPSFSAASGNVLYASSSDAHHSTDDNSELNVTITGAPQAAEFSVSPRRPTAKGSQPVASALDDLEEGAESSTAAVTPSKSPQLASRAAETEPAGADKSPSPSLPEAARNPADDGAKSKKFDQNSSPQDVSAVVDAEPVRHACTVPPSLAAESLRHLVASRSHEAFFDALDWLWCLTVADAAVVGAALTPEVFAQGLGRYLKAAPRTRRDRMLFTLLLLWLGHLHSISALRQDTHRCLLDIAARSLLPMLLAELGEEGGGGAPSSAREPAARHTASTTASLNVSAITPTDMYNTSTSGVTSAMALAASTGYGVPNAEFPSLSTTATGARPRVMRSTSPPSTRVPLSSLRRDTALYMDQPNGNEATLLPYAAARKKQEAALLLRPSIEVVLLAFLLNIYAGIEAERRHAWVGDGRVLDVALAAVRRASGVRSALLDTPTTIDGALSDEIYLDYALRGVRTDVTTVAVLGCRLMAAVLSSELRWGPGWRDAQQGKEADSKDFTSASEENSGAVAAAMHAELVLFTEIAMPLLVHVAVNNPDVAAAQEGGAASPVHHVPANLRCTRYTSLGESSLVALDACLQYYAQSGQLRRRGGGQPSADSAPAPAPPSASVSASGGDVSRVAIDDLVRVLPALTRVSHSSVHPPVRAVPYRCLLYICQRIEDVLVVLRDMPSLANAAVSCVLDYTAAASQWEVAAAAEWLTVLVDLLSEAEWTTATVANERPPPTVDTTVAGADGAEEDLKRRQRRRHFFFSPAEQLQEYFHFDDSPLARKLLTSIAAARRSNTGSAYAMSALLQLAVHLQTYIDNRQRLRDAHNRQQSQKQPSPLSPHDKTSRPTMEETATQPLTPAGLSSIPQWILLLQSAAADNTRLTRICAAFQRSRDRHNLQRTEGEGSVEASLMTSCAQGNAAAPEEQRQASARPVVKDAWVRALTASEQIALQFTFTATLFRALDMLLRRNTAAALLYGNQFSNALLSSAVVAAVSLPSPSAVAALLSMRFHASRAAWERDSAVSSSSSFSSPALLFGYQAAIQWACCVGANWMRRAYPCCRSIAKGNATPVSCGGGLPSPCSAALVEELSSATVAIMRDTTTTGLSQRTRCEAAALLSAVVEACPAAHLPFLESCGADLFAASTVLRRTPSVSGLQCRLLRRLWSAARYAASAEHNWLQVNLDALRSTVDRIKENSLGVLHGADGHRDSSPRRGRSAQQRNRQLSGSPKPRDAAGMAHDLQAFQVLTALLTSLVACVSNGKSAEVSSAQSAVLFEPSQRQTLCAILCDALRVSPLRHCILTALKGMTETTEGRRCLLTDISSAGDPLGRTLFGRVLALSLHLPCRWAGLNHASRQPSAAAAVSPISTQQRRQQHTQQRSLSPSATTSPRSSPTSGGVVCGDGVDADPVVVLGCDICTALLGQEHAEELAAVDEVGDHSPSDLTPSTGSAPAATAAAVVPISSFSAAFMRHRGLEYLSKGIAECDQQQRRQGRSLTVPLHLLRLLAALSLQGSAVKDIVKSGDLFSVVLELAGAAFPPHAMAATLALLTLRNVCFDNDLKTTLCQDARVLLTLKAAALKLTCVSQLIEDTPRPAALPGSGSPKGAPGGSIPSSPPGNRRTRVEVTLRDDVVDLENQTVVAWATQMCMYARARNRDNVARATPVQLDAAPVKSENNAGTAAAKMGAKQNSSASLTPGRRAAFGDITNAATHSVSEVSALSDELNDGERGLMKETAVDAEAARRQYLAATALASLWFDNQRGKAAIAEVLSVAPSCDREEMHTLARVSH
ncbi:hypothetical protein ABB37_02842 [Leptomonas pyrrhocoris]|uniref:Uncharacterized protein n=1 Tax=Leptomonas pyrrhocoris TaxID=157538 RepID=A0A0N0DXM2_LEPPY|nr:hypothetical protein ABB37_02842 [Leptomonas pyrrhocoris]KPA83145.1 hypothetical protein ABB37_02842 [Leptomonas pyrrhocoris]|eukprot:XP_015661584.1 hypothetical protein ABB37_02842 [Leptomonas pyrrhocoris]